MPIKPIDLQILFRQLDTVGRERAAEKNGAVIQKSIQAGVEQKKQAEKSDSVNELETAGEEEATDRIKVREGPQEQSRGTEEERKKEPKDDEKPHDEDREIVKDPDLGNTIDISG